MIRKVLAVVMVLTLALVPLAKATTVTSNTATVALNLSVPESITVTATPGSMTLVPNGHDDYVQPAATPVTVTTQYVLATGHTSLQVWSYFSSSTALTNGITNVPAAGFLQHVASGFTTDADCNKNGPFSAAASCPEINAVTNPPASTGTLTDQLLWGTDSNVSPASSWTAGNYNGVINIAAIAN